MHRRGQKRAAEGPFDSLELPCHLPDCEAATVTSALERWNGLRAKVEVLRPKLEQEDRLIQKILDRGLRSEDRKTLRKLVSGSVDSDNDEIIKQVTATIGEESEHLQEILMQNRNELLQLSTTTVPDEKVLLSEMDAVRTDLQKARDAVRSELLLAKERPDIDSVRRLGRSLNELNALLRRLEVERRSVTNNSVQAALLVTVCRRVLLVRKINPAELSRIDPSHEGYMQIMNFYFFSDASLYCFGEHDFGPNMFTQLKRNVAILQVRDASEKMVYNDFAVSGEHKTPGAPLAPPTGMLQSIEAEDEHGRVFDRRHDAEFKLLTGFFMKFEMSLEQCATWTGSGVLWSKKPLCRSCTGALQQLKVRLPLLTLEVVVGE